MKVAPLELQRALILALHTGQRQGDLLCLSWNNYDGSSQFLCAKERRSAALISHARLPCDGCSTVSTGTRTLILTTKTKLPWKARYFKAQWEAASRAAGITDLHFHDSARHRHHHAR
jgi:hypothetical protein